MLYLTLFIGCNSSEEKATDIPVPTASITWPTIEDTLQQGETIRLIGYVQDPVYSAQPNALRTLWKIGDVEGCVWEEVDAGGNTICEMMVEDFGDLPITLQVLNPEDQMGEATQTVRVFQNNPSEIEIQSPTLSQNYYSNIPIPLTVQVTDPEGLFPNWQGTWESSLEGILDVNDSPTQNGLFQDTVLLGAGTHRLSFTVVEDGIRSNTETIDISIPGPNHTPECSISTEVHELIIAQGVTAELRGQIQDIDIELSELSIEITSDLDGTWSNVTVDAEGNFVALLENPSTGIHNITLSVTDEVNSNCTETAELVVGYGPEVEVTGPSEEAWYNEGDLILFQGLVSDPNESPEDLSIRWHSNYDGVFSENAALSNGVAVTYAENLTPGQHIIALWAIDSDGFAVMDDVTVNINELPEAPTVSFVEPNPTSSMDLVVSIDIDSFDGEFDPITYEYLWSQNGVQTTHTGNTVPYIDTQRGDVWDVLVVPFDGMGYGASASLQSTIGNSAPILNTLALSDTILYENSSVDCDIGSSYDEDNDPISTPVEWYVNNVLVSTNLTITGIEFNKGDQLYCQSTPFDGFENGLTLTSNITTVLNTPPELSSTELSSTELFQNSTVECLHPMATDIDPVDVGNLTYLYDWMINGNSIGLNQNTLSGNNFAKGDSIQCSVTPTDGTDAGTTQVSNSTTVQNTAPSISSAELTPATVYENSTLTCLANNPNDIDGDSVSISYVWTINGSPISTTSNTINGADFNVGDDIHCSATPNDGTLNGVTEVSNVITVLNAPPTISTPTISPSNNIASNTTLSCSATATDIDDGNLDNSIDYSWLSSSGMTHQGASWTLDNQTVSPNDSITCSASVSDSYGDSASSTSVAVSVVNTLPTMTAVVVDQSNAPTATTINCSTSITDLDDGALNPTYTWFNGSNQIHSGANYTISAQDTNIGDNIHCAATGVDSNGGSVSDISSSVTIINSNPTVTSISISPNSGVYNDSTLTCSAQSNDIDQESLTTTFEWLKNQSVLSTGNSIDLSQFSISPQDQITCRAMVQDPNQGSDSESVSVVLDNRAPINGTVNISNSQPQSNDSISCAATVTDPDGDSTSTSYTWLMNGTVIGNGSNITLSPNTVDVNGTLTCEVSSSDGIDSTTSSASVTIINTAPTITTPTLSPSSGVVTGSTLTCAATGSDLDDGALNPTYRWFRNGTQMSTGSTLTLTSSNSDVGQNFYCSASVTDSIGVSASANSATVTVNNTAPTVSGIGISPNSGVYNNSTLTCSASASDPDQSVSVSYSWKVNGSTVASGATINLGSHNVNPTDSISCTASTSDSNGGSDSANTSVTVSNRSPSVQTPTLSASTPDQNETVTCSSSASDPDGESVSVAYTWTINGTQVGTGSSITLNSSIAPVGATLTCTASTSDGYGGSNAASASATIANNPPTITTPTLSPSSGVVTGSTLTCAASGSDPEDGTLNPTYRWFRNGTQMSTGSTLTLTSSNSDVGQNFYCSASVTDSIGVSASANSATVTVNNTPPVMGLVSITPNSNIYKNSTLACSASASDPDQSVSVSYSWKVNGSTVASGATINLGSHNVNPTDSISCTASTSDSNGGSDSANTSVTVSNRSPSLSGIYMSPSVPDEYDIVLCFPSGTDPDGDTLTYNYTWTVNGQIVSDYQAIVLDEAFGWGGSTLTCIATAEDPYGAVSNVLTISATIQSVGGNTVINNASTPIAFNAPPSEPTVHVSHTNPSTFDDITCTGSDSIDPEGGNVTYQSVWALGEEAIVSPILYAEWTEAGELWTCSIHVFDEDGQSSTNSTTIPITP